MRAKILAPLDKILEEHYLPQVNLWESSGGLKLLHDDAPCHKEHLVTSFLETHAVQEIACCEII